MFRHLPRNVIVLGLVSFFNDIASEMIYPLVPIFLTSVLNAPVPVIGLIEGTVEALASITKYIFGTFSDYLKKRKIFVTLGYSMGAISKLLIGLAVSWQWVLLARFVDRLGKGLRTAPRDSLLLENADKNNKGYIFGFHRSFDSLGAVLGPLFSLIILYLMQENLRLTFFIAFIPSVIAVLLLIFLVNEKKQILTSQKPKFVKINFSKMPLNLKIFLFVSFLFALGNSSDAFLLLNAKNLGLSTTLIVLVYVLYNFSQTVFGTPFGKLADNLGAKKVFSGGLLVFSFVYFLFGYVNSSFWLWLLFPIYGMYIAATDGVSKAYLAEYIKKEESGTYFGAYYTLTAIGTFSASLIGGLIWTYIAPAYTFYFGSFMAFSAFLILTLFKTFK